MSKKILIVGSETLLGRKLIEVYLNHGYSVAAAVMTSRETIKESEKKDLLVIPWNRESLVSAKTVFRETIRNFKSIDAAVFVNPELTNTSNLETMKTEEYDKLLNSSIHGTLYLLNEILAYFMNQESGVLGFAETEKGLNHEALIPAMVSGSFHNMSEAILQTPYHGILRSGFTSRLTEMEDYAQFIRGILETGDPKINGEWLQFSEKKNLFQSLPILKRK